MQSIHNLSPFAFAYFVFFSAVIGLCVGSFLNVVILRGLSGESIVLPPSKCPKCNNKLKWYDNIPVLSYMFLRGKCRFCKEHISWQYPLVELITAALFVLMLIKFDFTLTTLFMWAIVALFVVMSVTDLKEQVIITKHAYILIGIGIIYNIVVNHDYILPLIGAAVGFLTMELLARSGSFLVHQRAFGEGDSYIAAAIGSVIGWKIFLISLAVAVVLQTILVLPSFLYSMYKNRQSTLLLTFFAFILLAAYVDYNDTAFVIYNWIYWVLFALFVITGASLIFQIFKFTRNAVLKTIPFGPAMLIGAFVCIYFDIFISQFIF